MSDIYIDILHKDGELFYMEAKNSLEAHIIKNSPYLGLNDCLITYDPEANINPGSPFDYPCKHEFIFTDIARFRQENPTDYERLRSLHQRGRLATVKAVTDRWAEENPIQYMDFLESELSIKEFAKKRKIS